MVSVSVTGLPLSACPLLATAVSSADISRTVPAPVPHGTAIRILPAWSVLYVVKLNDAGLPAGLANQSPFRVIVTSTVSPETLKTSLVAFPVLRIAALRSNSTVVPGCWLAVALFPAGVDVANASASASKLSAHDTAAIIRAATSVPRMIDRRPLLRTCFSVAPSVPTPPVIVASLSRKRHVRFRPLVRSCHLPVPPLLAATAASPCRTANRLPFATKSTARGPGLPTRTARRSLLQSPAGGRRVRPLSVMKTYTAKPGEIQREWFLVDAEGKTLGRLATQIADRLRGKGKPAYTPHVDTGDFVIVVNAEKIAVTGLEARHEDLLPALRIPRRDQAAHAARAARAPPDGGHPQGREGHASEEQARVGAADEAEGLRRSRPPARRPGAEGAGARMSEIAQYLGTGKRKTSVARVILRPGDGKTWINGRTLDEYFPRALHQQDGHGAARGRRGRVDLRPARPRGGRRARRARPERSGTASPVPSSRRIPRCAFRSSARASSRATRASSSARRPACTRRARRLSSRSGRGEIYLARRAR